MQLELFSDPYGHVEDVMAEDDLRTAEPQMTLEQVLPLFEKVSGLPVVDTEGSVIGVITRKDLRRAARAGLRQDAVVEEVMTKQPITIGRRAHVAEAAGIMLACKVHRLPVVNGKRRLLGIVSRSDIFRPLLEPHRDLLDFALHREFDASHSPFAELGGTVRSLDEYDLDGENYVQIRDEIMGVASSSGGGGGGGGGGAASSTVEQSGAEGGSGPPNPEDPGEQQLYAGAYPKDTSSVGKKLALQLRREVEKVDSSDWQLKYLYDGECEMCRGLVRALLRDDGGRGRIRFVDFSAADYDPELNEDITPEEAVETIHVLKPDGEIVYGTEAVIEMYELVGKGGIVALARNPALKPLVNLAYTVLSRLRLPLGKGVESLVAAKRVIEVEAGNEHCGDSPEEEGGCVAEW